GPRPPFRLWTCDGLSWRRAGEGEPLRPLPLPPLPLGEGQGEGSPPVPSSSPSPWERVGVRAPPRPQPSPNRSFRAPDAHGRAGRAIDEKAIGVTEVTGPCPPASPHSTCESLPAS